MSTDRIDRIERIAAECLTRRDAGEWAEVDQAAFNRWLDASTLHRVVYLRLEKAWEDSARLRALGAGVRGILAPSSRKWNLSPFFDFGEAGASGVDEGDPDSTGNLSVLVAAESYAESEHISPRHLVSNNAYARHQSHATYRSARRLTFLWALTASIILSISVGGYYAYTASFGGDRYETPVGGTASVPTADGSQITLNTDSQIRVALSERERRIELRQGEAFFEVSHDANRPFIVAFGNNRVVAIGTKFSVLREKNDDMVVVVSEGRVRIEEAITPTGRPQAVYLTSGSIAHANNSGILVQRKSLPEIEEQLAWRRGILMFRDESLADAIAQFNRYNERKIVINNPAIAALKVEGNVRATNVAAFIHLLEAGFPVRAIEQEGQVVLIPK